MGAIAQAERTCRCGEGGGGSCAACRAPDRVPPIVEATLREPGVPLEEPARSFFGARFGHDFSGVRVHDDPKASDSASAVRARAYTAGEHVVFGRTRPAFGTAAGRQLLAHELAHVVQQSQTAPAGTGLTMTRSGGAAERAAEASARDFAAGGPVRSPGAFPVQLARDEEKTQESSTGGQVTLKLSGDRERNSPKKGVPISNGTLSWTLRYVGDAGSAKASGGGMVIDPGTDVQMDVTFTPKSGAGGCPTITFIQAVRATTGGVPDAPHLLPIRESSGFAPDVKRDRSEHEPYYGVGGQPGKAGLSADHSNTIAGTAAGRSKTATFVDAPVQGAAFIPPNQTAVREFEVAVICVETGATFGSLKWGYTKASDGTITLTGGQETDVQASAATATVEDARQAFYKGHFQHSLQDFARGSAALTGAHRKVLDQVAAIGKVSRIVLVGSNDFSGGPEAKEELSLKRAETARDYLVKQGVDIGKIEVVGHGVAARVPNAAGKQVGANRRVDVHIDRGLTNMQPGAQGSAKEALRFRHQDPSRTYSELVELLMQLQSLSGKIPVAACNQLTHMVDGLGRARAQDPTVPNVDTIYGPLIRSLRQRCQTMVPRERPPFETGPEPQRRSFIDKMEKSLEDYPF